MREAHTSLGSSADRLLDYGDGKLQGMDCPHGRPAVVIHVAAFIPDQPASLVPSPSVAKSVLNTSDQPPPKGHNFLEGDIFILISENHLILCPSGLRESAALHYVSWMLEHGISEPIDPRELAASRGVV
jgi:hypothetical protein